MNTPEDKKPEAETVKPLSFTDTMSKISELVGVMNADGTIAINTKNKSAARRARNAANALKKLITPLRQLIQDEVSKK